MINRESVSKLVKAVLAVYNCVHIAPNSLLPSGSRRFQQRIKALFCGFLRGFSAHGLQLAKSKSLGSLIAHGINGSELLKRQRLSRTQILFKNILGVRSAFFRCFFGVADIDYRRNNVDSALTGSLNYLNIVFYKQRFFLAMGRCDCLCIQPACHGDMYVGNSGHAEFCRINVQLCKRDHTLRLKTDLFAVRGCPIKRTGKQSVFKIYRNKIVRKNALAQIEFFAVNIDING